ncbi:DeoR/GlpR family DNA-binding transcription regulator [Paracoccus sp. (in: a-proteobacteria)]|uniref:DeoR/GlpR family DNA-binding transcription regulator n=1 Tax=Paracoccus sp. TaxID=267 RepID=UPI00396C5726
MLTTERKNMILLTLQREGRVVAKELSQQLQLSEDTIRRDLRELAGEGLLQRVHGGALPASPALASLSSRREMSGDDKLAIARTASRMVKNGQTVFLDGGTSTVAVARALPEDLKATVVTHSPDIVLALLDKPSIEIELIGGRIYKHSNVSVGAVAMEAIHQVHVDVYFMGVTGIHVDYGLTTGDREEAAIKRAICRQAGETVVLASQEKLGAVSAYDVVALSEIGCLVMEKAKTSDEVQRLRKQGVTIVVA